MITMARLAEQINLADIDWDAHIEVRIKLLDSLYTHLGATDPNHGRLIEVWDPANHPVARPGNRGIYLEYLGRLHRVLRLRHGELDTTFNLKTYMFAAKSDSNEWVPMTALAGYTLPRQRSLPPTAAPPRANAFTYKNVEILPPSVVPAMATLAMRLRVNGIWYITPAMLQAIQNMRDFIRQRWLDTDEDATAFVELAIQTSERNADFSIDDAPFPLDLRFE